MFVKTADTTHLGNQTIVLFLEQTRFGTGNNPIFVRSSNQELQNLLAHKKTSTTCLNRIHMTYPISHQKTALASIAGFGSAFTLLPNETPGAIRVIVGIGATLLFREASNPKNKELKEIVSGATGVAVAAILPPQGTDFSYRVGICAVTAGITHHLLSPTPSKYFSVIHPPQNPPQEEHVRVGVRRTTPLPRREESRQPISPPTQRGREAVGSGHQGPQPTSHPTQQGRVPVGPA